MGGTDDRDDVFTEDKGPKHMMSKAAINIDWWDTEEYRRCALACLVKAINVIENDALKRRVCNDTRLAPPWWESFHFGLKGTISDGSSIFGAIFELEERWRHPSGPHYVVAFRGTMLSHPNVLQELAQDGLVFFNALRDYKRFQLGLSAVESLIVKNAKVWLAGHSIGASVALDIGRHLMEEKWHNLPTFLFNPPYASVAPALDEVLEGDAMTGLYTASFMLKYVLAQVASSHRKRTKRVFERLSPWVPELYVNGFDFLSRGYIQYFEQRQLVYEKYPRVAQTAWRLSYRDIFNSPFCKDHLRSHLLPSARLRRNWGDSGEDAHSLLQWWQPDRVLSTNTYRCPIK